MRLRIRNLDPHLDGNASGDSEVGCQAVVGRRASAR